MHLRAIRRCFFAAAFCLLLWLVPGRRLSKTSKTSHVPPKPEPGPDFNLSIEPRRSIAVVAPCDIGILLGIERAFQPTSLTVGELVLTCFEADNDAFTSFLDQNINTMWPPVKVTKVLPTFPLELSLLIEASKLPFSVVLILDSLSVLHEASLLWIDEAVAWVEATQLPAGPCGRQFPPTIHEVLLASVMPNHNADILIPPIVVDPRQVYNAINGLPRQPSVWAAFAARTTSTHHIGSRVMASPSFLCPIDLGFAEAFPELAVVAEPQDFVALLANMDHLEDFQETYCRMASIGHNIKVFLFTEADDISLPSWHLGTSCYIRYVMWERSSKRYPLVPMLDRNTSTPTVLFVSSDITASSLPFQSFIQASLNPPLIVLPMTRFDLKHSVWMTILTARQWENWNRVTLDLSVITNNRPHSLSRLLRSLNDALYFGLSNVHLTIYMEQTADPETKTTVQGFNWRHGRLTVRHRVVKGGLIPAIVESWYPSSNDNYGLILEDDIELSPLYFAWAYMTILRYRYDEASVLRLRLYGISLYQPKNVELRPEGRRPWSAQNVLRGGGFSFPHSPYLSATPCSWGAIYFPEHWREFHDYLIARMSGQYVPQGHIIVPNVRSNRWQRSWKRFFIELQFLRGYAMLYPNYDDFVSFSTNHLELGSHVSPEKAKAKAEFIVPLMPLGNSSSIISQLPLGELPALENLPVVNLHGHVSSMDELQVQGESKRTELCDWKAIPGQFNASDLLCVS